MVFDRHMFFYNSLEYKFNLKSSWFAIS